MAVMGKFVITPHMRLQEWVADAKGYFQAEDLDYEFKNELSPKHGSTHDQGEKIGAYQTIEQGRESNVSCACHWTIDVAAANGHGKLYADAYSISPAGVFVPAESPIQKPEDLAGVPIAVGYQSGSHYSTIQALEQFMKREDINLSFSHGLLFKRMEQLFDRQIPAASFFSGPFYFMEQMGFRKVVDTTFMMAAMITGDPKPEDVKKYFRGSTPSPKRHRPAPGTLHPLLQKGISGPLPRSDGHPPLGTRRKNRLRTLLKRNLRRIHPMDRRERHLPQRPNRSRGLPPGHSHRAVAQTLVFAASRLVTLSPY